MTENLSVKEVVEIITACRKQGVLALSFRGLKFRLGEVSGGGFKRKAPRPDPETEKRRIAGMESRLKEDELAELRLRDPFEYEQLIQQNELTNDRQADS